MAANRKAAIVAIGALVCAIVLTFFYEEKNPGTAPFLESDSTQRAYISEIDAWHANRIASLKREHGWLSLIAREWLTEGANTVPSFGVVTLKSGSILFKANSGVSATLGGKPFVSGTLKTDVDKDGPDKIISGTKAFVAIKRGNRFAMRMWDSESPVRKNFPGVERYPVSPAWKIEARWEQYDKPKQILLPTIVPGLVDTVSLPGVAVFTVYGIESRLQPVVENPDDDYFFIFSDKTNGAETYGAGRFLYTKPPKDGKIVLDFNRAINPPCAFTPHATCPLPPEGNSVKGLVEAGEKKFGNH
jgi:hypothetical protein